MGTHETKRFKQKAEAEKVLNKLLNSDRSATVVDRKDEKSKKKKPFLYNLSSLQVDANKKYGFTLDHTLKLAQSLYEKGFTTYPRTDSMYLTEDMVPDVKKVLENLFAATGYSDLRVPISLSAKDRHYFNDSRVESHYAIIPTAKTVRGLTEDEAKLYDLIARSVICMVYPDAALGKTVVRTESGSETFTTSGNSVIEPGFYKVIGLPKQTLVPDVVKGETMQGTKYRMEPKKTEPPKRYTDATLLNAMKTCGKTIDDEELRALMAGKPGEQPKGLGRPSSQASIVDTLTKREYIERKGKTIYPTKKGIGMIDCFPVKDLKSALMTAQWEKRLDDIETGKDTYDSFMSDLEDQVRVWTRQILDAPVKDALNPAGDRKCPACGGDVRAFNWGYKCQACGLTVGKTVAGKKIPDRQMDKLFGKGETDVIDGFQSKDGKKFSARLKVDKENRKVIFDFSSPETTMKCPKCGKPVIHGPIGFFCSGYRETGCRFGLSKIGGKKVTEAQAEKLLSGKTISMSGLKSKKGTTYSAKVSMVLSGDECGQLKFEFPKSRQGGKK